MNGDAKKQINILVVEDDKFLRDLMSRKLQNENMHVVSATKGEEGLEAVKNSISGGQSPSGKIHLVILDLILPGIDGFEVLGNLKENDQAKNIPVIILSNLGAKEDIDKGMSLGAADYLVKAHFTPSEIISKVKKVLSETYIEP